MRGKELVRTYDLGGAEVHLVSGVPSEVELMSYTRNPAELMAQVTRGYKGEYSSRLNSMEEMIELLDDIQKTMLATPLEMVHFTFLFKGVTRAWTHQAVRYRVGTAYIQESMRFLGSKDVYEVFVPQKIVRDEHLLDQYGVGAMRGIRSYEYMLASGSEAQDARGVLPTNILTSLFWDMSLSTLRHIFNTRWCCQAQTDEWLPILAQIRQQLTQNNLGVLNTMLKPPIDRGEPCGFNASFDRPCAWIGKNAAMQTDDALDNS
jgi:flavin-dependent thymidylate synthase